METTEVRTLILKRVPPGDQWQDIDDKSAGIFPTLTEDPVPAAPYLVDRTNSKAILSEIPASNETSGLLNKAPRGFNFNSVNCAIKIFGVIIK